VSVVERITPSAQRAPAAPSDVNPKPPLRLGRLALHNVGKRFPGSTVHAVENISLKCEPGEFVAIVGPSGCGKSTLLKIAAGMIFPDSGIVTLDDRPTDGPGPDRAMVFQDHALFPWLTVADNVGFGLKMARLAKDQRQERVEQALKMVHLSQQRSKLIHELSGGMKQRVAIARALVMNPAVLLMDEPFASLDAQTRTLLHGQLQELWLATQKTILFVTHSVGEAVRLADRVIVLHSHPGRVRREIKIELAHPRDFDSRDVNELVRQVRREIEEEVNRVNAEMNDEYRSAKKARDLGDHSADLGSGI
jgi:NitT/TauT family transport system ATP-binding protein